MLESTIDNSTTDCMAKEVSQCRNSAKRLERKGEECPPNASAHSW